LFSTEGLYFDFLSCLTAVDNGVEAATMEVIYHLFSIPYQHKLCIKTIVSRSTPTEGTLPSVPSVSHIWRTANWHEREAYDLLGIEFIGHPDMRRILLPSDWEGYPLRKDYTHQEKYHGIRVAY
ncbi:MAG TPA: NADH-quinone oxidoreductase subunit C, partial [Microscillaceae bacterium]|nr:NADH-quinone oxidoreductase subunit C [Microscillaceae bacterium]